MSKIDELISSVSYVAFEEFGENRVVSIEDASDIMKIYAEWYAKQCLNIAAENVRFQYGDIDVEGIVHKEIVDLDYEKTFCFKLPEHE